VLMYLYYLRKLIMQVLMAMNETLIKFDSTDNIQQIMRFIDSKFLQKKLYDSSIILPYDDDDHHKRVFLLKWIYNIYSKGMQVDLPSLKTLLIQRVKKPIRLVGFINPVNRLFYLRLRVINFNYLNINIFPNNLHLFLAVKKQLMSCVVNTTYNPLAICIKIETMEDKNRVREFIDRRDISSFKTELLYNKDEIEKFMLTLPRINDKLSKAYQLLMTTSDTPFQNIKKQYKSLAKQYHPDTVKTSNEFQISSYTKKFQSIQNAYELIKLDRVSTNM